MANMKEVNKAIKAAYPDLKVELVRGDGYAYFAHEDDTFEVFPSIMAHPPITPTDAMIRMALDTISTEIKEQQAYEQEQIKSSESAARTSFVGSDCVLSVPAVSDLDNGSGSDPVAVEPAPLKEGDKVLSSLGGHRVVYVVGGDSQIGRPTPARIELWVEVVSLSIDLCVIDEATHEYEGLERFLERAAESRKTGKQQLIDEMAGGSLLVAPGHRGSAKNGAHRDYQKALIDQAMREVSESLRSTHTAQSRGQKRWNRRTMGYRNGY